MSQETASEPDLVRVETKLDVVAAKAFEPEFLAKHQGDAPVLFVDLSACPYISSAGPRPVLIGAEVAKRQDKHLMRTGMNEIVRDVFEGSGFDRMSSVIPGLERARTWHG